MRTITAAAALAASALTLAGLAACGTTAAGTVPPPAGQAATAAAPANPVPILKRMGVPTTAVAGEVDIDGDRYAAGAFGGGEAVTVYTFATAQDQQRYQAVNAPDDSHALITGRGWAASVTGVAAVSGPWFEVAPAVLAARSGGRLVPLTP